MLKDPQMSSGLTSDGIMAAEVPAEKDIPLLLIAPVDFFRVTWIGMD